MPHPTTCPQPVLSSKSLLTPLGSERKSEVIEVPCLGRPTRPSEVMLKVLCLRPWIDIRSPAVIHPGFLAQQQVDFQFSPSFPHLFHRLCVQGSEVLGGDRYMITSVGWSHCQGRGPGFSVAEPAVRPFAVGTISAGRNWGAGRRKSARVLIFCGRAGGARGSRLCGGVWCPGQGWLLFS
eukprot:Lithocolla_globosa_v1_NODE_186_length_5337_cov_5.779712.p5 type:complete len:180 gc:universal NODE_186_length_5337_cov_5.779712:2708-2169(-)